MLHNTLITTILHNIFIVSHQMAVKTSREPVKCGHSSLRPSRVFSSVRACDYFSRTIASFFFIFWFTYTSLVYVLNSFGSYFSFLRWLWKLSVILVTFSQDSVLQGGWALKVDPEDVSLLVWVTSIGLKTLHRTFNLPLGVNEVFLYWIEFECKFIL